MQPTGRLYLLFTPELCVGDPWETLTAALDAGVDLVQWRCKQQDRVGLERCRELCRRFDVPVIVNDDVMLAIRSRAAGAHVGQSDMPAHAARKLLVDRCLGVSTSTAEQIALAAAAGADYVGFGPCYPTATKGATKGYEGGQTAAAIEAAVLQAERSNLPLFAIGGIQAGNLLPLRMLGVDRIAVSGCILRSETPGATTAALRCML